MSRSHPAVSPPKPVPLSHLTHTSLFVAVALTVGPGAFHADNGTAESLASSRYTGKISLLRFEGTRPPITASNSSLPGFSAVCWYTGRHFFDHTDADTPLALIAEPVSGTPIEYWVRNKADVATCGNISGKCWHDPLSHLYNDHIVPYKQLGISAIVWDQVSGLEQHCPYE